MPNTKIKDQPRRLWKSLLRGLRSTPSSEATDSPKPPISRTIKFSESVARFNYIVDDLLPRESPGKTQIKSASVDSEVPADAIIFGSSADVDFKLSKQKASVSSPAASSNGVAASSSNSATSKSPGPTVAAVKASPAVRAPKIVSSTEAKPFVPLRDLFELSRRTRQLLNSFVLADARLQDSPVWAMSKALLPAEPLADGELLYFEDDFDLVDSGVITSTERGRVSRNLLMKRQMHKWGPGTPSFRLFSQVGVTHLTQYDGIEDPDECVWQTIATQELKKLLDRQGRSTKGLPAIPDSWERYLVQGMEALLAFHELFFMVEHPRSTDAGLEMTHVSARFLEVEKPYLEKLERWLKHDVFGVNVLMQKEQRFFFDAREATGEPQQLMCCTPLYGPELACWMCFLVSGPIFERSAGFV